MANSLSKVDPQWAWSPFEPTAQRPFTRSMAAHLYRRAGFGATAEELDQSADASPTQVVRALLDAKESDEEIENAEHLRAAAIATSNVQRGAACWLHRMLTSSAQAREKLTLFWHGHFASGAEKVGDLRLMLGQNRLLREHALGDFRELAHQISKDPAMLIYLDSVTNRKSHPNENYARELMELFCLGEGNYSEDDVLQLARCFTGWEVKRRKYRFNTYQHDEGEKHLLGRRGAFTGEQAVDVVLAQPAVGQFITQKLVRYYVMDEPAADAELLAPLASTFRDANLNVRPLVEQILCSNLFFSEHALARKVRSPIDLSIQLLRSLHGSANVVRLADQLKDLGHGVYFPPNVKGWDGGRTWVNTTTLLGRANLVSDMLSEGSARFRGQGLVELAQSYRVNDGNAAASWLCDLLLAMSPSVDTRQQLAGLASTFNEDSLRRMLHAIAATPECQLG